MRKFVKYDILIKKKEKEDYNMNKVVALVVTYNRKQLLKENIEALLAQTYNDFDILIVDNASTDGTEELVKTFESDRLKYINTGKNLGGAGGFNFGLRQAAEKEYEFCWLMDDDTIPERNALNSLVEKAQLLKNDFSFLSSVTKWKDGTICEMNRQVVSKNVLDKIELINNNLIPIEKATFVSFFVNLDIVRKLGLPISEFFIYADDWEYSLRLIKEKTAYLDCDSIVIHKMKENKSADIMVIPKERVQRTYYDYRNTFYIHKKYFGVKKSIVFLIYYWFLFFKIIIKAKDSRIKRIWYVTKGFIAGIFFNPKVEYVNYKGEKNEENIII